MKFLIGLFASISSLIFSSLLYFVNENLPNKIILDVNYDNLSDFNYVQDIKNFVKTTDNFLGFLKIENKKGISFSKKNYQKDDTLLKNFNFLKTTETFSYANYLEDIFIKNQFTISADKIGVVFEKKDTNFFDDNLNILFKFENKFLLTLNFLIYLRDKKVSLKDVDFLHTKVLIGADNPIYYDQKGKSTFLHSIEYNENLNLVNFNTWHNYFVLRDINLIMKFLQST